MDSENPIPYLGGWQQPAGLKGHADQELDPEAEFFTQPPAEIGEILSAETTLKRWDQPKDSSAITGIVLIAALAGAAAGYGLVCVASVADALWRNAWPLGLAAIGGLAGWAWASFSHRCTYVGKEGVASFACSGSRGNLSRRDVFCFRDATDLRTRMTRHYTNGVYTGTNYEHNWTDADGKKRYGLSGSYRSEQAPPAPGDAYFFALSAELAWSNHLLGRAQQELEARGYLQFNISGGDCVRVGPGFLELCFGSKAERCEAEQIDSIGLGDGEFTIKRKGASEGFLGLFQSGVFKFSYANMANTKVFLFALEKLLGYRFN